LPVIPVGSSAPPATVFSPSIASVVEAVQCAVDIQASLNNRNAGLPPERRMEFRIGTISVT
jgi:hypothetical protein